MFRQDRIWTFNVPGVESSLERGISVPARANVRVTNGTEAEFTVDLTPADATDEALATILTVAELDAQDSGEADGATPAEVGGLPIQDILRILESAPDDPVPELARPSNIIMAGAGWVGGDRFHARIRFAWCSERAARWASGLADVAEVSYFVTPTKP